MFPPGQRRRLASVRTGVCLFVLPLSVHTNSRLCIQNLLRSCHHVFLSSCAAHGHTSAPPISRKKKKKYPAAFQMSSAPWSGALQYTRKNAVCSLRSAFRIQLGFVWDVAWRSTQNLGWKLGICVWCLALLYVYIYIYHFYFNNCDILSVEDFLRVVRIHWSHEQCLNVYINVLADYLEHLFLNFPPTWHIK